MSDVKFERKESVSRDEAARWLSLLSKAFTGGDHAELPFEPSTLSLNIPDQVRAELEVEVDGDEVEVEVEFKWSTIEHEEAVSPAGVAASPTRVRHGDTARKTTRTTKSRKR
jgi:amphi-Trp domain-containing protein